METVSFILTTFNSKENLDQTLHSIQMQDYPAIEIVVKDGGSTDGTIDALREWEGKLPNMKWVSEPDRGIYDAMNRGYELSTGEILVFFNDVLAKPDVVSTMVKALNETLPDGTSYIGAHADLDYVEGDKVVRRWHMGPGKLSRGWMPGHPTLYLRRSVYEQYGSYDTSFRIAADYEFMVRFLKDPSNKLTYVPIRAVEMFYGGTSNQDGLKTYIKSFEEGYRALRKNKVPFALWINIQRTIRVLAQFAIR